MAGLLLIFRKQRILMKNCISDAFDFGSGVQQGSGSLVNIRCWFIQDH